MTLPYGERGPAHRPDPLTDSAIHRIGLGTQVRLHTHGGKVDCGLLDIAGVSTWSDLASLVTHCRPIEITGRHAFAGGVVLHAERLTGVPQT